MSESDTPAAVLITGATGGIGSAMTETMHSARWNVSLLDLVDESLSTLVGKLNAVRPESVVYHAADVVEVAAWVDKVRATVRRDRRSGQ